MRYPVRRPVALALLAVMAVATVAPASLLAGTRSRDASPLASATAAAARGRVSTAHGTRIASVASIAVAVRSGRLAVRTSTGRLPKLRASAVGSPDASQGNGPRVATPPPPVFATTSADPAATPVGFAGLDQTLSGAGFDPPDPWVGVNADWTAQSVNTVLRFTDRAGGSPTDIGLDAFFSASTAFGASTAFPARDGLSDPRIVWDAAHGRWLLTVVAWKCSAAGSHGYIFGALSDSADPVHDGWYGFTLDYGADLPDYPMTGTSTDKVAVSQNEFALTSAATGCVTSTLDNASVTIMDWASLLARPSTFSIGYFPIGPTSFAWRPALATPATSATIHLIGEVSVGTSSSDVGYAQITGDVAGGTAAISPITDLTTGGSFAAFTDPGQPVDPGGPIGPSTVDRRPTDAVLNGSILSWVSTYPCTPTGDTTARDCVRVSALDVGSLAPVQDVLFGTSGADTFMGGIGQSRNGTFHVVYSRSSATAGISSYSRYRLPSEVVGAYSAEVKVGDGGTTTYAGDRWGDYVGVAQDPSDPNAVWQADAHTASTGTWATAVSQLQTGGATYVPITPLRVLDTRNGIGLTGRFLSGVPRTWQLNGIPAGAVAITGNVTVTGQTTYGFVAVTTNPTASPSTSTINFPVGDNRANNVTVAVGPGGQLSAVFKAPTGQSTELVFDVTGYFLPDSSGDTYKPLSVPSPLRVLDTRTGTGLSGTFASGQPRVFQVAGFLGIPSSAVAVTGNVTVTQQTSLGFVAVGPSVGSSPATSTLNFPVGDNRANGFSSPLDGLGRLSAVFRGATGATTQLIVDISGYYVADGSGARYVPLDLARRMDTRIDLGLANKFTANLMRTLAVGPYSGVPPNAVAMTGNLTVTNQTAIGYIAVGPAVTANPASSTLNFPVGDNRANGLTLFLSGTGSENLVYGAVTGATTDTILDVTGYFR